MIVRTLVLLTVAALTAAAQTTTGSITGTVLDPSGAAVSDANVSLTDTARQTTVKTNSETSGRFVFSAVQPGNYVLSVEAKGFRTLRREGVTVQANDRLTLGDIALSVGNVSETIEVSARAVVLQTESAERSSVLVTKQLENIAVNGRSYLALAALTPGVVSTGNFTTAGTGGLGNISANGARSNQNQLTLNGIGNVDTGNNGDQLATISLDSVQEYRILTGSYQAEYGRSSGAQINVVTKSGTSNIHGSAYYYRRHDSLNANDWLSNRDGRAKKLYRYYNPGYTIGGPVYIPGLGFNKNRDKLFFFWSQEYQDQLQPEGVRRVTVPTALERAGDFSQSIDRSGNRIYVRDPNQSFPCNAGDTRGCFSDGGILNKIPASRLYKPGVALLNFFPAPTVDKNVTRDYNLESQISTGKPRREDLIRVDYNPSARWRIFTHFINNKNSTTTPYGSFVLGSNLPLIPITDARPGKSLATGVTTLISPTMTNEFTFGYGKNNILIQPAAGPSVLSRQTTGIDLPVLYPSAVQDNYIPNFGYGGTRIANSNSYGTNRAPFVNFNNTIDFIDNFSRVQNSHLLKFGVYMQRSRKNQSPDGDPNGFYDFGDNPSNPFDTGYGFSNAALGVYQTFRQNNKYATGEYRYWNVEWYAQDTWKITRRLTLDYGLRMAWIQPQYDQSYQTASWLRERYDPSKAVRLFYPGTNAAGQAIAIDRVTGLTQPSFAVGRIVPNSGLITNGVVTGKDIGAGLMRDRGIHWGPRLGIAYDVTGEGTFVIRTGGGIYYDRYQGNRVFAMLNNPPTALPAALTYGFATQIDPATALIGPPSLNAFDYNGQVPTLISYNFGIQKRLPYDFVLDVAYVGSQSRHLQNQINLNAVPYGAFFRPENTGLPADANFYRPYSGFGNINLYKADANGNYNALQISANRRMARNLFFDLAFTWSKALTTASGDGDFARIDDKNHQGYYALADYHRKYNLATNFIYEIPALFKGNTLSKAVFGGWQLSGLYQYQSGQPDTIGFSIPGVNNQNLTGSFTEGARIRLVGDPTKGVQGGPYFNINPDAFMIPVVGSIGLDAPNRYFIKPGINNWNMSLQKAFSIKEKANLQFRIDAFNVFNHTQFSDYGRTINYAGLNNPTITNLPRFDSATGRWQNPTGFGAVTAVRDPRIVQLMMRLQF